MKTVATITGVVVAASLLAACSSTPSFSEEQARDVCREYAGTEYTSFFEPGWVGPPEITVTGTTMTVEGSARLDSGYQGAPFYNLVCTVEAAGEGQPVVVDSALERMTKLSDDSLYSSMRDAGLPRRGIESGEAAQAAKHVCISRDNGLSHAEMVAEVFFVSSDWDDGGKLSYPFDFGDSQTFVDLAYKNYCTEHTFAVMR